MTRTTRHIAIAFALYGVVTLVALLMAEIDPIVTRAHDQYSVGVTVLDEPLVLSSGTTIKGEGVHATILRAGAELEAMVENVDTNLGNDRVTIEGLTLDCAGRAESGVLFQRVGDVTLRDVRVVNCTGHGIKLSGAGRWTRGFRIEDVEASDNGRIGIVVQWAMRDGIYDNVVAMRNGGTGIMIDHSEATASNLVARENGRDGIYLRNLFATTISQATATHNGRNGIRVEGWVHSVGTAWRAQANGQQSDAADILFSAKDDLSYGITRRSVLTGVAVGYYHELGWRAAASPSLVIEDGVTDLLIEGLVLAGPDDAVPPS